MRGPEARGGRGLSAAEAAELASLLAAVYACPEDDTVRLVLADWLDERDDPAEPGPVPDCLIQKLSHARRLAVEFLCDRLGGQVVRTISSVMRFDTATEVTTSQLRVELMFPADDAADAYFLAHQLT